MSERLIPVEIEAVFPPPDFDELGGSLRELGFEARLVRPLEEFRLWFPPPEVVLRVLEEVAPVAAVKLVEAVANWYKDNRKPRAPMTVKAIYGPSQEVLASVEVPGELLSKDPD